MQFHRITVNAGQMGGLPCIRGLRIPVVTVVAMIADGMSTEEILAAYPDLEAEDIREAIYFSSCEETQAAFDRIRARGGLDDVFRRSAPRRGAKRTG